MATASGLCAFLKRSSSMCKEVVGKAKGTGRLDGVNVHYTVGNEAGDCDSIISAIILSYLLNLRNFSSIPDVRESSSRSTSVTEADEGRKVGEGGDGKVGDRETKRDTDGGLETIHIPVVSIPRREFKFRPDGTALLARYGVPVDDLVFWDEAELGTVVTAANATVDAGCRSPLAVTLTDHNVPTLLETEPFVVQIVDHHRDEGRCSHVSGSLRNISWDDSIGRGVGSACTLLVQSFLTHRPDALSPDIAGLLLGVILLDTSNLDESAGRTTLLDRHVAAALRSRCIDTAGLFDMMVGARFNRTFWESLSSTEALALDYKRFHHEASKTVFGVASILLPIEEFIARDGVWEACAQFCKERGITFLFITSFVLDPTLRRELLGFCPRAFEGLQPSEEYKAACKAAPGGVLDCVPLVDAPGPWSAWSQAWHQRNSKASRKQVVPALMDGLSKLEVFELVI